jgi:hypothetical protein
VKPPLVIPSSAGGIVVNVLDTTKKALEHMAAMGDFYRKGSAIVRAVHDDKLGLRLEPLTPAYFQTFLFDHFNVGKWVGRGNNVTVVGATEIKESTVKAILGSHLVEEMILPVQVIAPTPYLVFDKGRLVLLKRGYNPQRGGILIAADEEDEVVPVEQAVDDIAAVFSDYDFTTPSDKTRAIGALFTIPLRRSGLFERSPAIIIEANDSQAGKTKMWGVMCGMNGLTYGTVTQKTGGVGSLDEQLMERLVDGCCGILLDNMRGKFDSPYFEACMTPEAGEMSARIAHVRGLRVDPRLTVFGMTSNGIQLTRDTSNRSLKTQIRKRPDMYTFKEWKDRSGAVVGLREHVEAYQRHYRGCVNSIVLDWERNGARRLDCHGHDFRECMGALDYICRSYFDLPPLLDGHRASLDRTTNRAMTWLRELSLRAATDWDAIKWTARRLAESCMQHNLAIPGAGEDVTSDAAAKLIGIAMGDLFATSDSIELDDVVVTRHIEKDSEGRTRRSYTFARKPKEPA